MAPMVEKSGMVDIPNYDPSTGSLVGRQRELIDCLLDGSWRTKNQERGTMGSVDTPLPDQAVKTPAATFVSSVPKWIIPVIGLVIAALILKGK